MSSLKYTLLLCVVALMVFAIPLYATDVTVFEETFGTATGLDGVDNDGWTLSSGSAWEVGVPIASANDPATTPGGGQLLGYNIGGDYTNLMTTPKYATSPEIDCTGLVSVKLQFQRWLTVEDNANDKAFIQVNNGDGWVNVWANPTSVNDDPGDADPYEGDMAVGAWQLVEYDISAVADGAEAVQVRWGLSTNGATPIYDPVTPGVYGGWSIDDVKILAAGPTGFAVPGWTPDGIWESGAPVAWAGNLFDDDGDPGTPSVLMGGDPGTDAAGGAGPIWGTDIGGDYDANMTPDYLTSDGFDCTGRSGVMVSFMRWLQVADGAFDKVSVQVQVDNDTDTPAFENDEVVSDDTEVVLDADEAEYIWEVDTAQFYEIIGALTYVAEDIGTSGTDVEVEISPDGEDGTWVSIGTIAADTADPDVPDELAFGILGVDFSDGSLFVKVTMNVPTDGTGTVTFSNLTVEGQLWQYVWQNPATDPVSFTFDEDWTLTQVPIGDLADGQANVRARFAMGSTTAFLPKWGGWSLDDIEIVEGSREYSGAGLELPDSLVWDESDDFVVTLKNTGTAIWDSRHAAFEVIPDVIEEAPLGGDAEDISVATAGLFNVNRWGVGSINVGDDDAVNPNALYGFEGTLTAPALSSVRYETPVEVDVPGIAGAGLDIGFALGIAIADGGDPVEVAYALQSGVAAGEIVVTRFSDDAPGTQGAWASYQIEELAGRVPFVVQGFGNGTYRSTLPVKRDAIAVFIFRAAELPDSVAPLGSLFLDVDDENWAVNEIQACYEAGIVSGFTGFVYRPNAVVKRSQLCKFVVNGVNDAHAGAIVVPTLAEVDAAGQDAYPFLDVVAVDDPDTDDNEQDPLANYILAAYDANIVQGFPKQGDEDKPTFRPTGDVTRGQLAMYIWRGFMRDFGSVVVLGGPGLTQVVGGADLITNGVGEISGSAGAGESPYSGLAAIGDTTEAGAGDSAALVEAGDDALAYVTFDAVRLDSADGAVTVVFSLNNGVSPTATYTVVVPPAVIDAWQAEIMNADASLDTDGAPYKTAGVPLDTAALGAGIFTMTTTVNGDAVSRAVKLAVMNALWAEDWTGGFPGPNGWDLSGQPVQLPTVNGDGQLELVGTQLIQVGVDTTGFHNIQLEIDLGSVDFGDDDSVVVSYSKDGGSTWDEAVRVDGEADVDTLTASLPNGLEFLDPDAWADLDPEEQADPANLGADNNANLMIKIEAAIADDNADGIGLVGNITISGT